MGRLLIRIHLSLSDNLRETRDYKICGWIGTPYMKNKDGEIQYMYGIQKPRS